MVKRYVADECEKDGNYVLRSAVYVSAAQVGTSPKKWRRAVRLNGCAAFFLWIAAPHGCVQGIVRAVRAALKSASATMAATMALTGGGAAQ